MPSLPAQWELRTSSTDSESRLRVFSRSSSRFDAPADSLRISSFNSCHLERSHNDNWIDGGRANKVVQPKELSCSTVQLRETYVRVNPAKAQRIGVDHQATNGERLGYFACTCGSNGTIRIAIPSLNPRSKVKTTTGSDCWLHESTIVQVIDGFLSDRFISRFQRIDY